MFRRRRPKGILYQTRDLMWPRAGWRRTVRYVWHRLHRMPGTTSAIAAGFASGAAVSFLPLNGLHFLLAAGLAWILRGSIVAAAVGTIVGNPWTFPPIWLLTYWVGTFLLGEGGAPGAYALDFRAVFQSLWYGLRNLDMGHLAENVWPVWWPMMVGSIPIAIAAWFAFYVPIQRAMERYHHARAMRRLQNLAAGAKVMQASAEAEAEAERTAEGSEGSVGERDVARSHERQEGS